MRGKMYILAYFGVYSVICCKLQHTICEYLKVVVSIIISSNIVLVSRYHVIYHYSSSPCYLQTRLYYHCPFWPLPSDAPVRSGI